VKDEKDGWFLIDFEGKDAYVSAELFHHLEDTEVVSAANFREEDNLNSEVYEVLEEGTGVKVLELAQNGFIKVEVEGKEGYIYNNLLKTFREANQQIASQNAQAQQAQQTQNTQNRQVASTG